INNLITLLVQPKNHDVMIKALSFLANLWGIKKKHPFFLKHINLSLPELFKSLETYGVFIDASILLENPLYDTAEAIVREFNLVKSPNAYVQFYLDVVLEYSQKKETTCNGFLEYYEKKKESLSIVSPKGQNAVQIMTIQIGR